MSVRQLRRTFGTPFIITLAGSSLAVACGPKPLPRSHDNPPGPTVNPPAPDPKPTEHSPTTPTTGVPSDPPPTGPVVKEPAAPAQFEQHWTVMKFKGKADCQAMVDVNCPKPEKGKPMVTCNPPPPIKYACPDGLEEGDTLKIVLRSGATECFVDRGPMTCPKGALCNPPPPRKVACPER